MHIYSINTSTSCKNRGTVTLSERFIQSTPVINIIIKKKKKACLFFCMEDLSLLTSSTKITFAQFLLVAEKYCTKLSRNEREINVVSEDIINN